MHRALDQQTLRSPTIEPGAAKGGTKSCCSLFATCTDRIGHGTATAHSSVMCILLAFPATEKQSLVRIPTKAESGFQSGITLERAVRQILQAVYPNPPDHYST